MFPTLFVVYCLVLFAHLIWGGLEILLLGLTACFLFLSFKMLWYKHKEKKLAQEKFDLENRVETVEEKTEREKEERKKKEERILNILSKIKVPKSFNPMMTVAVENAPDNLSEYEVAEKINLLANVLPPFGLIELSWTDEATSWHDLIQEKIESDDSSLKKGFSDDLDNPIHLAFARNHLSADCYREFACIRFIIKMPQEIRNQGQYIFAKPGQGKTQLIESMIVDDLERDCAIVVIDSQNHMINRLASRIDPDRVILIDPKHSPPPLNMFNVPDDEDSIEDALEFFIYIFSTLEIKLTGKQKTVYEYVARLLFQIPNANFSKMREILESKNIQDYAEYINMFDEDGQAFFYKQFIKDKECGAAKDQLLTRVYSVVKSPRTKQMFNSEAEPVDIAKAIEENKVILVSTYRSDLIGKVLISEVLKAVKARDIENRSYDRTYMYIDEFHEYVGDEGILKTMFSDARKYELGIIIASQELKRIPEILRNVIFTCTSLKFSGKCTHSDSVALANDMHSTVNELRTQPKGNFIAYFEDIGTIGYKVEFGRLDKLPVLNDISVVREEMRKRYSLSLTEDVPLSMVAEPEPEPYVEKGSGGLSFGDDFNDGS